MKENKIIILLLSIFMFFILVWCGNKSEKTNKLMEDSNSSVEDVTNTYKDLRGDLVKEKVPKEDLKKVEPVKTVKLSSWTLIDTKKEVDVPAKEFEIDSYMETIDGKTSPNFSVKQIEVKKWDKVRLKINVKNGTHDFKIDDFKIFTETPTWKVTTIEFLADKVGEFVYYCSKPWHKSNWQWWVLIVKDTKK